MSRPVPDSFFLLEPFIQDAGELSPWRHAEATVLFEGCERTFNLRVMGNFLFFVEKHNDDLWPVFVCTRPLGGTRESWSLFRDAPELLCHIFAREFEARRWGYYQCQNEVYFDMSLTCAAFFPDGRGLCWPWWDDRAGVPFVYERQSESSFASFLDSRIPKPKEFDDLYDKKGVFRRYLNFRSHFDIPANEPDLGRRFRARNALPRHRRPFEWRYEWRTGDRHEAELVLKNIWTFALHAWTDKNGDAIDTLDVSYSCATPLYEAEWKCYSGKQAVRNRHHNSFSIIWHGLLGRFYEPRGSCWSHDWAEDADPPRRVWHLDSFGETWQISSPTYHERLEAMAFLRDWLRDKISAEDARILLEAGDDPETWQQNNLYSTLYNRTLVCPESS